MSAAASQSEDIRFVAYNHRDRRVAHMIASMSLICIVLGACGSQRQHIVDEIVTFPRERCAPANIDETLTINSAYRVQMRSVRAAFY
jgi:hypothetical protein